MNKNALLSTSPATVAAALKEAIQRDRNSEAKAKAKDGQRYYEYEHDILDNRIFYIDDNNVLREDTAASNIKIPHPFHTELVDQKVQYLLSNPVELDVEDETFKDYLDEYYTEDFHLFLQEVIEGGSNKGHEYIYARTNAEDVLTFEIANSLQTFPIYDENNDLKAIGRYYDKKLRKNDKTVTVHFAEIWNEETVTFYRAEDDQPYRLDASQEVNPRPHVLAKTEDGLTLKRDYGRIPFYRYSNNRHEHTDLEPIKALIDDYDLMACFLSNNLQDFAEAIYVVKGFKGDDLSKLRQNVKAKKVVGTGTDGGLDIKTVTIPTEARETKLKIDKDGIYKFGMGFDSTQIGDGNITNVVIQSRYSLLDMKATKSEVRLKAMLAWCNDLIVQDINRRHNTSYDPREITITLTKETMVNENSAAELERLQAETRRMVIDAVLVAAPRITNEAVLKLICEQFELDYEEIREEMELEDYAENVMRGVGRPDPAAFNPDNPQATTPADIG